MLKRSITQYYHMVYLKTSLDMIPPMWSNPGPILPNFMIQKTYTQHTSTNVSCQNHIFKNVFLVKQDQKHLPLLISLHIIHFIQIYRFRQRDVSSEPTGDSLRPFAPSEAPHSAIPLGWWSRILVSEGSSPQHAFKAMDMTGTSPPGRGEKTCFWNHHLDSIYHIFKYIKNVSHEVKKAFMF